jgi:hypothetical protein
MIVTMIVMENNHTYLAGLYTENDSIDSMLYTAFGLVEKAYYKFKAKSPIYLLGKYSKKSDINFVDDVKALKALKLFEGSIYEGDDAPSLDKVKKIIEENSDLKIYDDGYFYMWFLFNIPDEDGSWEPLGSNWEDVLFQIVKDSDAAAIIGYHSGIRDNIWQQWCDGELDEGAISHEDIIDHYRGKNLSVVHGMIMHTKKMAIF